MAEQVIPRPTDDENFIIFGDGYQAFLRNSREVPESAEIEFEFRPTPMLRYTFQITDNKYTNKESFTILKRYPKKYCVLLTASPRSTTWLLFCNFEGQELPLINRINSEILAENVVLKKENLIMRRSFVRTFNTLDKLAMHPMEVRKSLYTELKQVKQLVGNEMQIPGNYEIQHDSGD